jgi:3-hydroxybutyryl-CoA dehydratase
MMHRTKTFADFQVGDAASFSKTITDADIVLFAGISGDTYPLHLDETYAAGTRFGKRIAHGMLSASLISTSTAALLGVPGGIYVEQSLRFRAPVFVGDTLTARTEVVEIIERRQRLRAKSTVVNQHGKIVVDGESILQKDA